MNRKIEYFKKKGKKLKVSKLKLHIAQLHDSYIIVTTLGLFLKNVDLLFFSTNAINPFVCAFLAEYTRKIRFFAFFYKIISINWKKVVSLQRNSLKLWTNKNYVN